MAYTTIDTPVGEITIVGAGGVVTGVYHQHHEPEPNSWLFGARDDRALAAAADQLLEYFAGDRTDFTIATRTRGTEFQERVWGVIREIPFGETRSYGEIAAAAGNPKAVRAVGLANWANPLTVLVPCHRVLSASGKLNGYAGGIENKRRLLAHEAAVIANIAA